MSKFTIKDTDGYEYVVETKPNGKVISILSKQLYAEVKE